MTPHHEHELSARLASHVRSTDAVPDDAVERAQARLTARMRRARGPARTRVQAWLAATAAAMLAVVMMADPMLSGGNDAFAAVQAHFHHFDTLSMTVVQRLGDKPLQNSRTVVDARGVVRTDVGDQLSIIVDPPRGRVLTLLHEPRQAMVAAIPKTTVATDQPLPWLEELRNFKGQARPLSDTRIIDGRTAHGWVLQTAGGTLELWADADNLPVSMRQHGEGGLAIDYRLEFDRPIPPGWLSSDPPAGYALAAPDGD